MFRQCRRTTASIPVFYVGRGDYTGGGKHRLKCIDCPHFEIKMEPWNGVDFWMAVCKKYDLVCDYTVKRQLKRLECVEGGKDG